MGISYAFVNLVAKILNNLLNALFYKKKMLRTHYFTNFTLAKRIILPIPRLQNALY